LVDSAGPGHYWQGTSGEDLDYSASISPDHGGSQILKRRLPPRAFQKKGPGMQSNQSVDFDAAIGMADHGREGSEALDS
jgi:hypothetical protein